MNRSAYKIIIFILPLFMLLSLAGYTQKTISYNQEDAKNLDQIISIDEFNPVLMQNVVLIELNKLRRQNGLDEFTPEQILTLSAKDLAGDMADKDYYKIEEPAKVVKIVRENGGTRNINQVVTKASVKKNLEYLSYSTLAEDIVAKWNTGKKNSIILNNNKYIFIGIGASLNETGKKLYVAAILGNYYTYNNGAELLDGFEYELTDKSMGLSHRNEKTCKKIDKYDLIDLQDGLSIEENSIYFKTNDLKAFKKIIKKDSRDGLAVDIVLKDQYPCDGENIINFEQNSRGIMTKPMYANKIYSKNEYEPPESKRKLIVKLGELPPEIGKDFELNLVLIKDKSFCKSIPQSFLLDGGFKPFKEIKLLADTVTINSDKSFIPEAANDEFIFRIPLEKGKSTYSYEEIKPFLDDLNAPPFIINEVNIAAFSSLEESSNKSMIQYHKKAESIVKALGKHQEEKFKSDIITSNSWSIFRNEVIGTEYENLAFMGFKDALKYIKQNNMIDDLEPIFKNDRFAQVQLSVLYDLRGEHEQEYVLFLFNKAINNNKLPLALSIQKYISKMIIKGKYDNNSIIEQSIPLEAKFAGLLMNKLWLQNRAGLIDNELLYKSLIELNKLSPGNAYIKYNLLANELKYKELGDDYQIYKVQSDINKLYSSTIGHKTMDALNLEYQFKVISVLDTLSKPSPHIIESLDNIKSIFNLNSASWKNSLELAYLFINHKDYDFAARLLDVFVEDTNVDEELLFTYLSLCSVIDNKYYSKKFESALKKAQSINKNRYCELFDGNHFSLRVFENPNVKEQYCKTCGK